MGKPEETAPDATGWVKLDGPEAEAANAPGFAPTLPSLPHASPTLPAGTAVGRYIILKPLGEGGMGVVYLAHDPELDRKVALKLLRSEIGQGQSGSLGRDRLVREAHAMAKLSHPNVVAIYDSGIYEQQVFLAVELVDGWDLWTWLDTPREWREVLAVFLKAGRGLAAAHAAGLVHRDFKPENVLLGKNGDVKVSDFGLARAVSDREPTAPMDASPIGDRLLSKQITQVGRVSGTPGYIAPETLRGRPADARSDEFAFCVALYGSLYGDHPFADGVLSKESTVATPPPGNKVPAWVRNVVQRGLAFDPDHRFSSLDALLIALADDPAIRRRRWLRGGELAAIAVASLALVVAIERRRTLADPCHAPEARLAGVWNAAVRTRIRAAFRTTGLPDAASSAGYAEKAMDRAATAWVASYRDACEATRVHHTQSEAALNLRLDCLADQRLDLLATAEILSQPKASAKDLSLAVAPSLALPTPAECADAHALAVIDPPSPELREELDSVRLSLARGRALKAAAKYADAVEVLKPLPDRAKALGSAPLEVRAVYELARATASLGDSQRAIALYLEAENTATVAHLDGLGAQAAAAVLIRKVFRGDPNAEIDEALAIAKQDLRRAGVGGMAEYRVEEAIQIAESFRGRPAEAMQHGRRALEIAETLFGPDRAQMYSGNLAWNLEQLGRYEESLEVRRRTVSELDAVLGPTNRRSDTLTNQLDLGIVLFSLGRADEAQQALTNLFARVGADDRIEAAEGLAIEAALEGRLGRPTESLRDVAKAIAMATRLHQLAESNAAEMHDFLIEAYLHDAQPKLAIEEYENYVVPNAAHDLAPDNPNWVSTLRLGGWVHLDAGEPMKALPLLERALTLSAAHPFYPGWVPRLRYQLAKALILTHGDHARAESLVRQARDSLAKLDVEKDLRAEVDDWMTKNRFSLLP